MCKFDQSRPESRRATKGKSRGCVISTCSLRFADLWPPTDLLVGLRVNQKNKKIKNKTQTAEMGTYHWEGHQWGFTGIYIGRSQVVFSGVCIHLKGLWKFWFYFFQNWVGTHALGRKLLLLENTLPWKQWGKVWYSKSGWQPERGLVGSGATRDARRVQF